MSAASDTPKAAGQPRLGRALIKAFVLLGTALAVWLLWHGLKRYSMGEVLASLAAIPRDHLAYAVVATAASYMCLTGFDWLALRHLGRRLPYRHVALASFVSLSLGHSIGFAGLSSGPIRYRFYSRWGLTAADVAQVVVHCGTTVGLGLLTLGGFALLLSPRIAAALTGYDQWLATAAGILCLAAVVLYLLAAAFLRREVQIRGHKVRMPRLSIALGQVVIGTVNFACVAACLYAVVSTVSGASYGEVAATYVTGNLATLVTHVPGGLGVIESTVMYLLHGDGKLIGPLLVFRAAYFFLPLLIGGMVFAICEVTIRRRPQ